MSLILNRLERLFTGFKFRSEDPFLVLVRTVLSQNTSSRNVDIAFRRLVRRFRTPRDLAYADEREIARLIKPSGMHKLKSRHLKRMSAVILKKYRGDVSRIIRMPYQRSKLELMSLPGVGQKTADVVLAFSGGRDVFPVDTHVFRLSKRLGFADQKDGYDEVKKKLEQATPRGKRVLAHLLLIQLGRSVCRARNPKHRDCPIRDLCPSYSA